MNGRPSWFSGYLLVNSGRLTKSNSKGVLFIGTPAAVGILRAVGRKLRVAGFTAKGSFVNPVDEVAAFLKLNREKERRGDVDSLDLDALRIAAAISDLVRPKIEPRRIRLTIQEIKVMLTNEELGTIDQVDADRGFVVGNRDGRAAR